MKKYKFIFIILFFIILIGIVFWAVFSKNNLNNNTSTPQISKISYDLNIENNKTIKETKEISSYSTQIKDNAEGRLNNIRITCNTLNKTIINPGETFSFNDIVGKPTSAKGYMEAHIIVDDKLTTGIGGGNCQVSSTLYNAVLEVPDLQILERHEHGLEVTYVPKGKDACVSFGSLDFKFKNNLKNKILIQTSTDDENVTIKLFEIIE